MRSRLLAGGLVTIVAAALTACSDDEGDPPADSSGAGPVGDLAACGDQQADRLPDGFDAGGCRVVTGAAYVGDRLLWGVGELPDGAKAPRPQPSGPTGSGPTGAPEPTLGEDVAPVQPSGEWVVAWDPETGEPTPIAQLPGGSWGAWTVTIDLQPTFLVVGKYTVDGQSVPYARGWDVNTLESAPSLVVDGDLDATEPAISVPEDESFAVLGEDNVYVPGAILDLVDGEFGPATEPADGEVSIPDGPTLDYVRVGVAESRIVTFAEGEGTATVQGERVDGPLAGFVGLTTYGAVAWAVPEPESSPEVEHSTAVIGEYAVDVAVGPDGTDVTWVQAAAGRAEQPDPEVLRDTQVIGDDVVLAPSGRRILFGRFDAPPLLLDVASGEVAELDVQGDITGADGASVYLSGEDGTAVVDLESAEVAELADRTLAPTVVGAGGALFDLDGGETLWAPRTGSAEE